VSSQLILKVQEPPTRSVNRRFSAKEQEYITAFSFLKANEGKWVLLWSESRATRFAYLPEAARKREGEGFHFTRRKNENGLFDIYGKYDPTITRNRGVERKIELADE
jgi:hypothetical protein